MIPSVAFHGARPASETAVDTRAGRPVETAPLETPHSPPVPEVQPSTRSAGGETRLRSGEERPPAPPAQRPADENDPQRATERESTRPVAGDPRKTVAKMREALTDALGPPFSDEEASLAAQANRTLMDAQSELRRLRAAEVYAGVDPSTGRTAALAPDEPREAESADEVDGDDEHVDRRA